MKKIILSIIVTLFALVVNAQGFGGPMNPEDMAKHQAARVKETCGTNDEQYKAVYTVYLESSKKMMEAMQSGEGFNPETMQKRMEETNAKIKAILTPEQYVKYEEMQKKMRERFRQGGGFGGPRQ